jgi:integrase
MATIRKRRGRWEVRFWGSDGKQHSKSCRTKNEANAYRSKVEVELNRGSWKPFENKTLLFETFARDYLDAAERTKRATTLARDIRFAETYLIPTFGSRKLSSITRRDVETLVDALLARHLAPKTIRTAFGVLRTIFSAAIERELVWTNPCSGMKSLPPDERKTIRFLDSAELKRLADTVPPEYRALIYLLGVMGLRWSEAVGLRVRNIDFLQRTLQIEGTIAEVNGRLIRQGVKTAASRATLSVPQFVLDEVAKHLALVGHRRPEDLVFTSANGTPVRASNFRNRIWNPAVERAGLTGVTPHALRHTAAGLLTQLGAHPKVIQQRLRHASIRTTFDVYGAILPSLDEAVVKDLNALVKSGGTKRRRGKSVGHSQPSETA